MSSWFITILNMSLVASYVALLVIIVRWLFTKMKVPKIFSYVLWALVLFRLTIPFSYESSISLLPIQTQSVPQDMASMLIPKITTDIAMVDRLVNDSIPSLLLPVNPADSVNPLQVVVEIGAVIWFMGAMLLLLYGGISYFRLKHRLSVATLVKDRIYETDRIQTPFALGLIKPTIYVPTGLSKQDLELIVLHEQTHIRRYDHWIKPLAFVALAVHWFNPIVWLSYLLMTKDMEMSCDEAVMKLSETDARADYSKALLTLASKQSGLLHSLPFGRNHVKSRIKNILKYKKPTLTSVIATLLILIVFVCGTLTNPKAMEEQKSYAELLLERKSPYVGNASNVGQLWSLLEALESYDRDYMALQTVQPPYFLQRLFPSFNENDIK